MGLDLSHTDFSWSYIAFHDWRMELCRAANVEVGEDDSFTMDKDDILYILLIHSDCDGAIKSKDCGPLANRLEELSEKITKRQKIHQEFIAALRECEECGDDLEFI